MTEYLAEHWVISVILTIVLGAIGSGLWEAAFKPIMRKVGGYLFTLLTFGAKRARNYIYKNAAMGHHEVPSLHILLIIFLFTIVSITFAYSIPYITAYAPETINTELIECNTETAPPNNCFKENLQNKIESFLIPVILSSIFSFVFLLYTFMTINQTNLVITYYEQCCKVIRPYISDKDFYLIEQKYALMRTKENYVDIITELKSIAERNSIQLPESYIGDLEGISGTS
ncbi:hypothetical protein [Aeromonas veronii]|uniref:hypothetical protein n=2 Tax=Aeromonas veronii TaxID=654 RepID=UPI00191C9729|nr:hypothetical protein [Aeromonas veronii]EKP0294988.1 hypothetical protein [Aeromonas veronii]MBL0614633.1 hypothetical protein [Aeromonas veronii]